MMVLWRFDGNLYGNLYGNLWDFMVGKTGDELDYLNNEDSPRKNSGHKMASWEKSWALFMIDGDLPSGKPTVCYG